MKRVFYVFSMLTLGVLGIPSHASAQCVQADVSVQAAITGSLTPAEQTNNVQMYAPDTCSGNYQVSDGTQVVVGGTDPTIQRRDVIQQIETGYGGDYSFGLSPVQIPVNSSTSVYNPAAQYLQ